MKGDAPQGEIDWRRVHIARVAACCTRAAQDFDLSVESPFTLNSEGDPSSSFIACFPSLGGGNGMLVCLASEWDQLEPIATRHGYSCAGLDPKHHTSYNRTQWQGILEAWAS